MTMVDGQIQVEITKLQNADLPGLGECANNTIGPPLKAHDEWIAVTATSVNKLGQ